MEKHLYIQIMREERYTPTDFTPLPVAVDQEGGSGPDSGAGISVTVEAAKTRQVSDWRERIGKVGQKAIKFGAPAIVFGATLVGMEGKALDAVSNARTADTRAATTQAKKTPNATSLKRAQAFAAPHLFNEGSGKKNVKAAQKIATSLDKVNYLDPSEYIDPDRAKFNEDGRGFVVDGQTYYLGEKETGDGSVYHIASRTVVSEGKAHMFGQLVVGGAHKDDKSDINGDGITSQEEVHESADIATRRNFRNALKSVIVGANPGQIKPDTFVAKN